MERESTGRERSLLATFFVVWFAVAATTLWSHEMWRDELQAWSIGRSASSLADVVARSRYESQPSLWPGCLHLVSRVWDDPRVMQVLHLAIASASVLLVLFWAPFSAPVRMLLCCHYVFSYEYVAVSRNYAVGLFLTLLACRELTNGRSLHWRLAFVLGLLCQTSVYGVLLAFAFVVYLEADHRRHVLVLVVAGLAAFACMLQVLPPADSGVIDPERSTGGAAAIRTLSAVWDGCMPVPPFRVDFWGHNVVTSRPLRALFGLVLGGVMLTVVVRQSRRVGVFLGVTFGALVVFVRFVHFGAVRHHVTFFVAFVAALWLAGGARTRSTSALVGVLPAGGLVAAGWAHWCEYRYPFSAASAAAAFLRSTGRDGAVLAGDGDGPASAVGALLGREVFFLRGRRFGAYVVWDKARLGMDEQAAMADVGRLAGERKLPVVMVMSYPVRTWEPIAVFDEAIVQDERFWLYETR